MPQPPSIPLNPNAILYGAEPAAALLNATNPRRCRVSENHFP